MRRRDKDSGKPDYTSVPSVVFSSPQLAYVGKHEAAAVKEYGDVDVYTSTSTRVPGVFGLLAAELAEHDLQGLAPAEPHAAWHTRLR